jgi:hypothetical protein
MAPVTQTTHPETLTLLIEIIIKGMSTTATMTATMMMTSPKMKEMKR